MGKGLYLELPWPPSVNHYWKRAGKRTVLSEAVRKFRREVKKQVLESRALLTLELPFTCRLRIEIRVHPPDRRRRDIDNLLKSILDALEKSRVYDDDEQFDELWIERDEQWEDGGVEIYITSRDGSI